jgi:hypothetical protein
MLLALFIASFFDGQKQTSFAWVIVGVLIYYADRFKADYESNHDSYFYYDVFCKMDYTFDVQFFFVGLMAKIGVVYGFVLFLQGKPF